jgi:Protein of unknown function (DUF3616)/Esterase-like activity of phytase
MRAKVIAVAVMLIGCPIGQCFADQQIKLKALTVNGKFEGKKDKAAVDISGIACQKQTTSKQTCLLVNDENKDAQFATLENDELTVGGTVTLIGKTPSPNTLGQTPEATCEEDDGFKDLDGEGVAYADSHFYVIGSHGCSRKNDQFRLSSFILARFKADQTEQVTTTYRVSDLLKKSDKVVPFFGKDLDSENGLNIEGIAASGDTLWVGLRAPVTNDGDAYLVGGSIAEIFHAGRDPAVTVAHTMGIKLDGRGIRDLAPLPDGRLLVLAGPAQGQDVSYGLYIADPRTGTKADLGTLEAISQDGTLGKAEGLTVLQATADKARLLVVFDGLKNGDPHVGEVDLPR